MNQDSGELTDFVPFSVDQHSSYLANFVSLLLKGAMNRQGCKVSDMSMDTKFDRKQCLNKKQQYSPMGFYTNNKESIQWTSVIANFSPVKTREKLGLNHSVNPLINRLKNSKIVSGNNIH